jgi:uncharacterized membrane protein (Fun14 family)
VIGTHRHVRPDPESGRILLLTIGLVVLALMIVAMVASATTVHLDKKHLYNLADELATSAANTISKDLDVADTRHLVVSNAQVARAVAAQFAAHPDPALLPDEVRVVAATSPDGHTVRVELAAASHPALVSWFTRNLGTGFPLAATSTSRIFAGAG